MTVLHSASPPALVELLAQQVRWQLVTRLAQRDMKVQELVSSLGQPFNLVSYHLKKLREGDLVKTRRSDADGRDVYYSLDLGQLEAEFREAGRAIHPGLGLGQVGLAPGRTPEDPITVLFLCTHNSARSQMAEGHLRAQAGASVRASSAGSQVTTVRPEARAAMAKLGVDLSGQRSKHMDRYTGQKFDFVITVCDRVREICPAFPEATTQLHWSTPDPVAVSDENERIEAFDAVARELQARVHYFLEGTRRAY